MSDELQAAIATIKRETEAEGPWGRDDMACEGYVRDAIAGILNAVASGALVPAPAVPDDVAELVTGWADLIAQSEAQHAEDLADAEHTGERPDLWDYHVFVDVQTAKATRDALEAQAAELARLKEENALMAASLDEEERKHGLSTNGGMWRLWSQQLREYHDRRKKERDAHTAAQPAPDAVADDMAELLKKCRDRISTDADAFFKAGRISRAITCDVLLDRIDAALAKEART